jgi:hypothetical protein
MTYRIPLLFIVALIVGCPLDDAGDTDTDTDTGDTDTDTDTSGDTGNTGGDMPDLPCDASELDACLDTVQSGGLEPCLTECEEAPMFDIPCGIAACQVQCWIDYTDDLAACYDEPNECERTLAGDFNLSPECSSTNSETNDECLTGCLDGVEIDCQEVFDTTNSECVG